MALPLAGMFHYVCVAPTTIPQRNEVELNGKDLRGKGPCLLGPSPTIILRPNQVVLAAKQRADATAWKLSFAAGDALLMAMQAGDEIYMTRGGTGDLGLSLLRNGDLVVAVGDARSVPLGKVDLPADIEKPFAGPLRCEPDLARRPVRFQCGGDERSVGERECGEVGDYDLYVERLGRRGFPGQVECVAISRKDVMGLKIAAMRSAILLANSGQHIVKWEFFGDSSYGL